MIFLRAGLIGTVMLACGSQAVAGSAAQPGQTVGLPVGAPLPVGLHFIDTSSFGVRDTSPRGSESNINLQAYVTRDIVERNYDGLET